MNQHRLPCRQRLVEPSPARVDWGGLQALIPSRRPLGDTPRRNDGRAGRADAICGPALATAGYRVVGTSRKPAASPQGVTMLICYVTDEASVQTLIAEIVEQAGRIDLVVNNAGI